MSLSRREFLVASAAGAALPLGAGASTGAPQPAAPVATEPWLEVDREALRQNVRVIARLSERRPIIVVAKNNAYGLGVDVVGPALDPSPEVWGFAVVRVDEAIGLRDAGVRKPILLMARYDAKVAEELVAKSIHLTPLDAAAIADVSRVARRRGWPARLHLYVDTGMSRMGVPPERLGPMLDAIGRAGPVRVEGMLTELTEDVDYDREQVGRLRAAADDARRRGVDPGKLHAASSAAVWKQPETHLDLVRPGLGVYGGYVSDAAMAQGELRAAYRLKAPVVRVEQVQAGEGVSYHRRWKATRPTWVATLPVGHVDGYPSGAAQGGEVLIGGRLYRVIGTVSASHTVIEVGPEQTIKVGDVATLVGPDHPAIHPNAVAKRASWSEYNMFMHLNPSLGRVVL